MRGRIRRATGVWVPVLACVLLFVGGPAGAPAGPAAGGPDPGPAGSPPRTVFGAVVQSQGGQRFPAALAGLDRLYGHLGVVRLFQSVPTTAFTRSIGDRSVVVSFDLPPAQVLSGADDAAFRTFFAAMPRSRPTWWSYFHEPDLALEKGTLTDLAAYRAAFTHVAELARAAGNPELRSTLVLTCFSANPASRRSVTDFWPGPALTDVLAWDCYNGFSTRKGSYGDPAGPLTRARDVSAALGKPWAVAEWGSTLLSGDDGSGRAAWMMAFEHFVEQNGAQFAVYFNTDAGPHHTDYRLQDAPSQAAFRSAVE